MAGVKNDQKKKEKPPPKVTLAVFMFPNGDRYEGECILTEGDSLEKIGTGTYTTASGIIYQGIWEGDKMNGPGMLKHPSNASYEGEFLNNQFHGKGKYSWADGSFYEGQFVENRLEGPGAFTDAEGQTWLGSFNYKEALGLKFQLNMN